MPGDDTQYSPIRHERLNPLKPLEQESYLLTKIGSIQLKLAVIVQIHERIVVAINIEELHLAPLEIGFLYDIIALEDLIDLLFRRDIPEPYLI